MVRKVLIGAVMVAALFASPAAAQYSDFVVNPGAVDEGGTATFQGSGCPPGATVTITIDGRTFATVVANDAGQYNGSFVADLAPGNYTVTATCGDVVNTSPLTVRGVSTSQPDESGDGGGTGDIGGVGGGGGRAPLPRTGSNTNTLALMGAALLVVGGGAMVASRKRFA